VVPVREDDRRALVALDQQAALVVGREVHRTDHPVAAAFAQPGLRRAKQCVRRLARVLAFEEAEHPPAVVLELVEAVVDVRGDAPDRLAVAPGEEVLGLGVLEERVALAVEPLADVHRERRDPARLVTIERRGKRDETPHVAAIGDRPDLETHPTQPTCQIPPTSSPRSAVTNASR
jgi:hypothetical protein